VKVKIREYYFLGKKQLTIFLVSCFTVNALDLAGPVTGIKNYR